MKGVFALVCFLFCLASVLNAQNPVTNGGFEELDPKGFPLRWSSVGGPPTSEIGVSTDAHSGKYSLRLCRVKNVPTEETGLNRDWRPFSGEQGDMLAEKKGAISFWYKVVSGEKSTAFVFYVIPMSAKPLEDTGLPRQEYRVPASHIGDGKWHQGVVVYDFSNAPQVKWVMLAPRIWGGVGEWLIDDVSYMEKAGVVPVIDKVSLEEVKGREGEEGILKIRVSNKGDERGDVSLSLSLPSYLSLEGSPTQELTAMERKETREVSWKIRGRRDRKDEIGVVARSANWEAESRLGLSPQLGVEFKPQEFIGSVGKENLLRLILSNEGNAFSDEVVARISLPSGMELRDGAEKSLKGVAPHSKGELTWRIIPLQEAPQARVKVEVSGGDLKVVKEASLIICGKARKVAYPTTLNASLKDGVAILGNEKVCLIFSPSSFGYGVGEIMVRKGGEWEGLGKLPYLSRIVYSLKGENKEEVIYAPTPKAVLDKNEASLLFSREITDEEGGKWSLQVKFSLKKGEDVIRTECSLSCDKERPLLLFEGPILYAGEGSFGESKEEALFPGLEWLVDDERSSSSLDIAEGHPDRIRYVPHPNKITIPLMSVYRNGTCLGLLWDVYQKWDGRNDRPSAVFASPNWFEERNNHLMGLFLPSVPQWVKENERIASEPYPLGKGKTLSLVAFIYASGKAEDALSAMDKWFALFKVPEPTPIPRGDYLKEIEFSMQAYLKSLWVPEEEQWWTTKGAGPLLSGKGRPSSFLYDLYQGSLLAPSQKVRTECKAMLDLMTSKYGVEIAGDDLGFTHDLPLRALKGLGMQAVSTLGSQWEDGSWRFYAERMGSGVFEGMDYRLLGPHNAAEVGTCAHNAWQVLRYVRMTGDESLLPQGLKALEFMKRFRVPRAAQVWEVPVHTPDVLAASDAIDAYIEGYRITGNEEYLDEAKKWARRGLPFIYMWNEKKFPFMRYASIPVFGASWFEGSWFGRPVQWNGLRYAYALLKLADYDQSFPWRKIAEGITRSAMYQQDEEGENVALWPDSIGAIKGDKASWVFSPMQILKNVYKLLGRDSEPATTKVGDFLLNYRGRIRNASLRGGKLSFEIALPQGEPGWVVIARTSPPKLVKVNGKEEKWDYDESLYLLGIRLQAGGWQRIEVEGIEPRKPSLLPALKKDLNFEFQRNEEGWTSANDIVDLQVKDGYLEGKASGPDPYMNRLGMDLNGSEWKAIIIRMKTTGGDTAQFYWTTQDSPAFAEDKVVSFPIISDGEFHEYKVELDQHPMWKGKKITAIRLDPTNGAPGAFFSIDYIKGVPQ